MRATNFQRQLLRVPGECFIGQRYLQRWALEFAVSIFINGLR